MSWVEYQVNHTTRQQVAGLVDHLCEGAGKHVEQPLLDTGPLGRSFFFNDRKPFKICSPVLTFMRDSFCVYIKWPTHIIESVFGT